MRPGFGEPPGQPGIGMAAAREAPGGHARRPRCLHPVHAVFDHHAGFRLRADAVCRQMVMSKRSLYRHLAREEVTFQSILDETRTELALHYLRQDDVSVEEISYLLAYSDPNSFYRAFRNWTGMTPLQARARLAAGDLVASL